MFGLHVTSGIRSGVIALRPGGLMASADSLKIDVEGRQTHGSQPWRGIDPVVTSAQIILALQTIVSRQLDPTITPAVISVSTIHGGVRNNIMPDSVAMEGTIRTHDEGVRAESGSGSRRPPPPSPSRRRQGRPSRSRGRAGDL